MSDTLGTTVDKLITVDMKMWANQEFLYEIRRMSFEEFEAKFSGTECMQLLFDKLKKACDLNVQRNQLINEVDERIIELIRAAMAGKELDDGKFLQRAHKTY